ncbi:hypothetical protein [Acidocella sp.]|uniref:hypothetical protein n=1 Tax=Acidocella sp. TaxID=50710 RepID=UPI002F423092
MMPTKAMGAQTLFKILCCVGPLHSFFDRRLIKRNPLSSESGIGADRVFCQDRFASGKSIERKIFSIAPRMTWA